MQKDWCKKPVALFLAISILLPSFFLLPTQKAAAQVNTDIFGTTLGPIAGGVAAGIASCTNIGDEIKTFIKDTFGDLITIENALNPTNAVPIQIVDGGEIEKSTKVVEEKEKCYDAIFYNIAKVGLRAVTQELLSWINSGFDGYPFYRDSGSYFTEVWENELNSFSTSLVDLDENLYPWAKAAASDILLANQAKFENYARYTLNEFVVGGADGYRAGFSAGGWGAWEAMLLPQNNPIGFRFLTEQELDRRTGGGTEFSINPKDISPWKGKISDRLTSGFFSDERCAAPTYVILKNTISPGSEENYIIKGKTYADFQEKNIPREACDNWEIATPGQAMSGALDISLGTKVNQLELADEMNESIAAVFDALVSELVTMGVSQATQNCGIFDPDPTCPDNQ